MTQLHPNILGALSALADLADQHRWLADLLEPGTPQRRPTIRLSAATRALLDRQTRAERKDQVETARQGLAPRGPGKTPVVLTVLDVQMQAVAEVMHAAWQVTSALATHPDASPYRGGGHTDEARFAVAVDYLRDALALVHPDLAGDIGRTLNGVAQLAERATGHAPSRHDLADNCPACGDRFLQVTTWGTDDAVVSCRCKCWGRDCGCKRPGRLPDARHVWRRDEFGPLTELLRRGEAA
jgi:hypothetical protein